MRVPIFAEWHYWWVQQLADVDANSEQQETQFFSCTKKVKCCVTSFQRFLESFLTSLNVFETDNRDIFYFSWNMRQKQHLYQWFQHELGFPFFYLSAKKLNWYKLSKAELNIVRQDVTSFVHEENMTCLEIVFIQKSLTNVCTKILCLLEGVEFLWVYNLMIVIDWSNFKDC